MAIECIRVTLRIGTQESSPQFITDALGINPTQEVLKGELSSPSNLRSQRFKESAWILSYSIANEPSLERHIEALVSKMAPKRLELASIFSRLTAIDICFLIQVSSEQGGWTLDADVIQAFASLNASVTVEYFLDNG